LGVQRRKFEFIRPRTPTPFSRAPTGSARPSTLDDGFDVSPAVAGNDLLLRGHKWLYCIGEK
jgi:hypothetical protein